ncbi:alpha/beta hydrolase [Catenulispora pinisilvae]|uniref:alpha/beta hydrolase n=1 Tax=Catenulispora pinisilvae TaxID=2705253 RepID=UPI00189173FB|nr:alpha/beta hydrolase [Catenulispora pinisilvae]
MRPVADSTVRSSDWSFLGLDGDPTPGDYSAAAGLASDLRGTGDDAYQARQGVKALLQDPALVSWLGRSGEAFKSACEPFPNQLASMYQSFHDAADALEKYRSVLITTQGDADAALANARSAFESVGLSSDRVSVLAGLTDDTAYLHRALVLLQTTQPSTTPGLVSPAPTRGVPAPGPTSSPSEPVPSTPQPSKGPGPWAIGAGPSTPEVQRAFDQIHAARGAVVQARDVWSDAQRNAINSIHRATDAAVLAARWADGGMGSGTGGTFDQRFAAFGGNVADLVLPAAAGFDLGESALPAADASAADVMAWWASLSPAEQAAWESDHPDQIGSLDGIPAEIRDKANRKLLDAQISQLKQSGSDPALLATLTQLREQLNASGPVLKSDNHQAYAVGETGKFKTPMPPLYLLHYDTQGNGHLIMAAGNPDTAQNVVTYVPGLGTKLGDHMIGNDIPHTENLYLQAMDNHAGTTVSSVFWLGYDAPQIGGGADGPMHALDVSQNTNADAGAPNFTAFLNGLHATSTATGPVHYTALGHSYGSLVVGTAAAQPGGIPVDDIVFVGSPGVSVNHASGLNIPASHVWAGAASNDPVPNLQTIYDKATYTAPLAAPLLNLLPAGPLLNIGADANAGYEFIHNQNSIDTHGGWFGQNPVASEFGGEVFAVAPGDTGSLGMDAHGEYFDPRSRPLGGLSSGSSLNNMANIITGDYGDVH